MTEAMDQLRENANAPKRASGDVGEVEQHALTEQIAADKYLHSKQAASLPGLGIKLVKLSPDGAI